MPKNNIVAFVILIVLLALRFKLSVHSWIRSEKRNAKVGGHEDSMHLYGLAVDIYLDDEELRPAFIAAAKRLGLHVVTYEISTSIHLQASPPS